MRFKGNALYYSIIIILLSSSTVGLILLRSYYQSRTLTNIILKDQLEQNIISAFNIIQGGEDVFQETDQKIIDLFNDSINQVELSKRNWGAYSIITAKARQKAFEVSKSALIGANLDYEEPIALFIPDRGRIVSFSGSTSIRGTCYLPQKVARPASIEGQPFIYKTMTFGEIKASPKELPQYSNDVFQFSDRYFMEGFNETDSLIDLYSIDSDVIINSFNNKTLIVMCKEAEYFSDYSFSGNVIIWATQPITITATTTLRDIIVFAPSITIEEGFSGSFQAYALQSILVGNNCKLEFPTTLNVIQIEERYNPVDSLKIFLGNNSQITGGIFIRSNGLNAYLKINIAASVHGQIYIPGNIELLGEVIGSVYCRSFFLQTARARYENHLLNCKVDRLSLSPYFVGLDSFNNIPYKSIIQWLN